MLLQQIVRQLDAELERLTSVRKVVAGLQKTSGLIQNLANELEKTLRPSVPSEVKVAPRPRGRPAKARAVSAPTPTAKPKTPPEPTALTSAIPARPVVILPQALARERASRTVAKAPVVVQSPAAVKTPVEAAQEEAPDSLVRSLSLRWRTSAAAM